MSGPASIDPPEREEKVAVGAIEVGGEAEREAIWRELAGEGLSMTPEIIRDLVLVVRAPGAQSAATSEAASAAGLPGGANPPDAVTGPGALSAGLSATTYGSWLFISHLWVAREKRGAGLGPRLLGAAYREAAHRGCRHVHVETRTSRALAFYIREGFILAGEVPEFLGGEPLRVLYRAIPAEPEHGTSEPAVVGEGDEAGARSKLKGSKSEPSGEIFPVAPARER